MTIEIKNAIIRSAKFDIERGLSAWLMLDYGGSGQGFGGYLLYAPPGWKAHTQPGNFCGHFIWRCLEIASVDDWSKLPGRTIRVKADHGRVHAIGHIIEDRWFDPSAEFQALTKDSDLTTAAQDLKNVAENFEITGPDADGLVWLVLHGNGTTGEAMIKVGAADRIPAQVAMQLEKDRRAAIAQAGGTA